jgi:hypothetical protein
MSNFVRQVRILLTHKFRHPETSRYLVNSQRTAQVGIYRQGRSDSNLKPNPDNLAFNNGDRFSALYKIIHRITDIFGVAITNEIDQAIIGKIANIVFMAGMVVPITPPAGAA